MKRLVPSTSSFIRTVRFGIVTALHALLTVSLLLSLVSAAHGMPERALSGNIRLFQTVREICVG